METLKEVIKKYDDELELILNYHEVELISKIHNVQQRSRAESIRDILNVLKNLPNEYETRELLSDYAHEAWCGWMKYMFSKAKINEDETWTMPQWAVERWQRQMTTRYSELSEEEKKSDRDEADKMLAIFMTYN